VIKEKLKIKPTNIAMRIAWFLTVFCAGVTLNPKDPITLIPVTSQLCIAIAILNLKHHLNHTNHTDPESS